MTPREHAANAVMNFHAKFMWGYDPVQHEELELAIAREIEEALAAKDKMIAGLCDRVEKQAELLSKRAERTAAN